MLFELVLRFKLVHHIFFVYETWFSHKSKGVSPIWPHVFIVHPTCCGRLRSLECSNRAASLSTLLAFKMRTIFL